MRLVAVILGVFFFSGCSYVSSCSSYVSSYFVTPTLTFQIETTDSTNDRTPVYLLVKTTDLPSFLQEDYHTIAKSIAQPDKEFTPLIALCMIPGTTKTIKIPPPEDGKPIALYVLFTHPGNDWKYLINQEECIHKIDVCLGSHEIISVNIE